MKHHYFALTIWFGLLILAYPYVVRFRHPDSKPVAAYMIFVTVFSATAMFLFFALLRLAVVLGLEGSLQSAMGAVIYFALVFIPAFLMARWQLGKPPTQPPELQ